MLDDFATRTIFTVETTQSGMDSLCLRSDNRKEDAMNQKKQKKKDENLITRHRVLS